MREPETTHGHWMLPEPAGLQLHSSACKWNTFRTDGQKMGQKARRTRQTH